MSLRSSVMSAAGGGPIMVQQKLYKHIDLMNLTAIRRVVDLVDGEDCRDCFTLVCRTNQVRKQLVLDSPSSSYEKM